MSLDFINTVIPVLVAGSQFVGSTIAKEEVKQKYLVVKDFIIEKLGLKKEIEKLERNPSEERQKTLAEDLVESIMDLEASEVEIEEIIKELLKRTNILSEYLQNLPKEEFDAVGADLEKVKAVNVKIKNIISEGGSALGLKAKNSEFSGDIDIDGVRGTRPKK